MYFNCVLCFRCLFLFFIVFNGFAKMYLRVLCRFSIVFSFLFYLFWRISNWPPKFFFEIVFRVCSWFILVFLIGFQLVYRIYFPCFYFSKVCQKCFYRFLQLFLLIFLVFVFYFLWLLSSVFLFFYCFVFVFFQFVFNCVFTCVMFYSLFICSSCFLIMFQLSKIKIYHVFQ